MGTPEYARIILSGLIAREGLNIRVVTKADTRQGRRLRMTPSPVAQEAERAGLVVDKPQNLMTLKEAWQRWEPHLIITAAYGKILRPWVLQLPHHGAFNLHASLLPRWRGPNPIAWTIRAGDQETGVTLMKMDEGVDTGDIVAARTCPVLATTTTGELTALLAREARDLVLEYLDQLVSDNVSFVAQDHRLATYAGKFDPGENHIQWNQPAKTIDCLIRSMSPEPGAYTICQGIRVKLLASAYDKGAQPLGMAQLVGNTWHIGTRDGVLVVNRIQPAGRKAMSPGDFQRGLRVVDRVVCE